MLAPPLVKSLPSPPMRMSQAGTGVDGVVAGTALGHVVAGEVGDDVVALAAERDVGAVAALDDVVALAAPEGVVVVAAADPVDAGGAVVDALAVDAGRDRRCWSRGTGSVPSGMRISSGVLVALGCRVVLDGCLPTELSKPGGGAGQVMLPSSNLQSAVANASALRVCALVLRMTARRTSCPRAGSAGSCPGCGPGSRAGRRSAGR